MAASATVHLGEFVKTQLSLTEGQIPRTPWTFAQPFMGGLFFPMAVLHRAVAVPDASAAAAASA